MLSTEPQEPGLSWLLSSLAAVSSLVLGTKCLSRLGLSFLGQGWLPLRRGVGNQAYCGWLYPLSFGSQNSWWSGCQWHGWRFVSPSVGFWGEGGIEAAVHAARFFLHQMPPDEAFVKLDFKNGFNSLRCDKMLDSVLSFALLFTLSPTPPTPPLLPSFGGMKSFSQLRGYNRETL